MKKTLASTFGVLVFCSGMILVIKIPLDVCSYIYQQGYNQAVKNSDSSRGKSGVIWDYENRNCVVYSLADGEPTNMPCSEYKGRQDSKGV